MEKRRGMSRKEDKKVTRRQRFMRDAIISMVVIFISAMLEIALVCSAVVPATMYWLDNSTIDALDPQKAEYGEVRETLLNEQQKRREKSAVYSWCYKCRTSRARAFARDCTIIAVALVAMANLIFCLWCLSNWGALLWRQLRRSLRRTMRSLEKTNWKRLLKKQLIRMARKPATALMK